MKLLILLLSISIFQACSQTSNQSIPTIPTKQGLILSHAKWQATQDVTYDGSYRIIGYPNGDVPDNIGVCTDVVIRAYRAVDVDLQTLIHEDVQTDLGYYYPILSKRGTAKADANIDHRRVHIIRKFLNKNYPESPTFHFNFSGLFTDLKSVHSNHSNQARSYSLACQMASHSGCDLRWQLSNHWISKRRCPR